MGAHFEQIMKQQAEHNRDINLCRFNVSNLEPELRRRWLSSETRSWLIGGLRASIIFGIIFAIVWLTRKQEPRVAGAIIAALGCFIGLTVLLKPE